MEQISTTGNVVIAQKKNPPSDGNLNKRIFQIILNSFYHIKRESQMYIPEFWGGVIATVFAEFVALMVWAVVNSRRKNK